MAGKRNALFWVVWLGLIVYAFFLAPPNQPDTFDLIKRLSTGQWAGINPLIVALFNLMGVWPMIYAAVMLVDGCGQKLSAWPFVVGAFGVGAFAVLPYLALRQPSPSFSGPKTAVLRLVESRLLGTGLFLGSLALMVYGLGWGDWADFMRQWQSDRFIHVMSLDFCLLSLLFPALLADDKARRAQPSVGQDNRRWLWLLSVIPVLGPAAYLSLRPGLPDVSREPLAA